MKLCFLNSHYQICLKLLTDSRQPHRAVELVSLCHFAFLHCRLHFHSLLSQHPWNYVRHRVGFQPIQRLIKNFFVFFHLSRASYRNVSLHVGMFSHFLQHYKGLIRRTRTGSEFPRRLCDPLPQYDFIISVVSLPC